jgi:hypothetical protein
MALCACSFILYTCTSIINTKNMLELHKFDRASPYPSMYAQWLLYAQWLPLRGFVLQFKDPVSCGVVFWG